MYGDLEELDDLLDQGIGHQGIGPPGFSRTRIGRRFVTGGWPLVANRDPPMDQPLNSSPQFLQDL